MTKMRILCGTILSVAVLAAASGEAGDRIEVVAVYYPHWHRYPKGDEWFGGRFDWSKGEWEFVKTAIPRYPGHVQPVHPVHGYLDGSDPEDVAVEIDLAADAGIDVFLYDYYYYGGKVTQEEAIEQGFLKAKNRDRMKFALMWCYHERRDQFRPQKELGDNRLMLMELDHTPEEFLGLIDLSIARYFGQPEYWRKDGRLFFSIFNAPYFLEKLGENGVRNAIAAARGKVRAAGLGEIHFNAQGLNPEEQQLAKSAGFDSLTDYNIPPDETASGLTSYESMAKDGRSFRRGRCRISPLSRLAGIVRQDAVLTRSCLGLRENIHMVPSSRTRRRRTSKCFCAMRKHISSATGGNSA